MKKIISKVALVGLIIFLLMQLYQPARNSDYGQVFPTHIFKVYTIPENVKGMLQVSCFNCHSNATRYPWYAYIQPARSFMERHIEEGKQELNFSEFGNYSERRRQSKLRAMVIQIQSGAMPLSSYTMIHKDALLSDEEKVEVINWLNTLIK